MDAETVYASTAYVPNRNRPSLKVTFEILNSAIEQDDDAMGAMQQKAAAGGQMREVIPGRNEPALRHFHQNYREALNEPSLEPIQAL